MKIELYTLCYNEEAIIPYVVDYYKNIINQGIDLHVNVFDNYSTDSSVKLLSKYDFITVRQFYTSGMDDVIQAQLKNNAWKAAKGKVDFVIVCDFDEIIYSKDLNAVLTKMREGDYNVLGTPWYMMCSTQMPQYEEGKLLHEIAPTPWFNGQLSHLNQNDKYCQNWIKEPLI